MRMLEFIKNIQPNYVPDWYHELWAEETEMALESGGNVISSAWPGSGKTQFFSILLPAYLIYRDPMTHVILTSNSDALARLAATEVRRIIQSPVFQDLCPMELTKATENSFMVSNNDGRPTLHSAGIRGQLTGHRANYLIFDDLLKSLSEAYSETTRQTVWSNFNSAAETRLLPGGQIFGIHTRWHLDDPIGQLVKRAKSNPRARQFRYINLAATNLHDESYIEDTSC
ncbi:MAG: terminase family protein [Candidatus Sulfotelmatobacter sp.]